MTVLIYELFVWERGGEIFLYVKLCVSDYVGLFKYIINK